MRLTLIGSRKANCKVNFGFGFAAQKSKSYKGGFAYSNFKLYFDFKSVLASLKILAKFNLCSEKLVFETVSKEEKRKDQRNMSSQKISYSLSSVSQSFERAFV